MKKRSINRRVFKIFNKIFYGKNSKYMRPLLKLINKFIYIRFYGGQIYLSPLILEKKLHKSAKIKFDLLKERYEKERCFVIGNAPSLNKLDLKKLKNEVTIGSNGIYLNFDKMEFSPTIFTVTSYLIAEQMGEEISKVNNSIKILPSFLKRYFKKCQGELIFLNADGGFKFSVDITNWISWQSTVTFFNLQIAYSLGCPEVYLIGVDNDFIQPPGGKDGKVLEQKENVDLNHFAPNYFPKGFKWQQGDTENMRRCYELAYLSFKENNRRIMNATVGGKLEVFQRVEYSSLF